MYVHGRKTTAEIVTFISLTKEAGVFVQGSDYFLYKLRGKLWQRKHWTSPQNAIGYYQGDQSRQF